ncbi:MAG: adenine phosphoribosyltransferase [Acidimicrobiales bacterium]
MEASVLRSLVRDVADFPRAGVVFKDITPMLAEPAALRAAVDGVAEPFLGQGIELVVGIEARGFILAAPVAERLGAGFVPVRKPGKLPWRTERITYELEYGTDTLEVHIDAVEPGQRVLVVDDVLATGGTAASTAALLERLGAEVVGLSFLIELTFLGGRARIGDRAAASLLAW